MSTKIKNSHLTRSAVIYLRQSTLKQVRENTESTIRQYDLQKRATMLGWSPKALIVIDEDLGQSGSSTQGRTGFLRLAEDIAQGRVGAVFALEVSRLARNSADWHQLLDLCGWANTVIADDQSVYDPQDPNDRLLLGLKGQMSEAEKYWLKMRMQGARISKALRGELSITPPSGYQRDEATGSLRLDPDEQVQQAIRLIFKRFEIDGSACGVRRYFIENNLKMPVRRLRDVGEIKWISPRPRTVTDMLHSPIYAGAYVYGRREVRTQIVDGKPRHNTIKGLPRKDWKVFIPDHHPAYITWEQYLANQKKLSDNTTSRMGAAREGMALLQGIVICGRCGHSMTVSYQKGRINPEYVCRAPMTNGVGVKKCWTVAASRIDQKVAELFVEASRPPELELALAVSKETAKQASDLDRQWRLRLEKVRYEAKLAERRYRAVDPDNRVVARTLEIDWEQKLNDLSDVERDYAAACQVRKVTLSEDDRMRILALARDLPRVWNAPTTTHAQRKTILRMLVKHVTLSPIDVPIRQTRIQILWDGSAVTDVKVDRPQHPATRETPPEVTARIKELVEAGNYDVEIAPVLNSEGLRTCGGKRWTDHRVGIVRRWRGWSRPYALKHGKCNPDRRDDGLYSTKGVAKKFGVTRINVQTWVDQGLLKATDGGGMGRASWFKMDTRTIETLRDLAEEIDVSLGKKDKYKHKRKLRK